LVLGAIVVVSAALFACTGGGSPAPAPTATPPPTASPEPTSTPVDLGPPRPERARILEHVRVLAGRIGSRVAGSPQEEEAVAYAREQFERWGYEVELQPFAAAGSDRMRLATLTVETLEETELRAVAFEGSPSGEVRGPLVDAGTGREEEFPAEAAGAVVLIQRGDVLFVDMARRAQAAGALAVVVANREPGRFRGEVDPPSELPVVNIDQSDGELLRALLTRGSVEVDLNVRAEVTAHNVIARPDSGQCRTLSGGHHDSVPWSPGANDNASGSGVVLEVARAAAVAGLAGHCFVLFGAEELGLLGSAFFVSQLTEEEREELDAFLNFDVTGTDARPLVAGDAVLLARAGALAERAGLDVEFSSLPYEIPSDHRNFLDEGIAALVLHTPDPDLANTPEDTLANLEPISIEAVAALGFALLEEMDRALQARR
jgi:aminopeptidase YwaD